MLGLLRENCILVAPAKVDIVTLHTIVLFKVGTEVDPTYFYLYDHTSMILLFCRIGITIPDQALNQNAPALLGTNIIGHMLHLNWMEETLHCREFLKPILV